MHCPALVLCAFTLATIIAAPSQKPNQRTPEQLKASYEAHRGDFDYLLGDWTFTAESRQWGKFGGLWSAVRLAEGQILDEYRIVGDKGDTIYVTSTLRNYNAFRDRWELVGVDSANGIQDIGSGQRVGNEVHIEQRFGVAGAEPSLWRIRYFDIKPDSFSWSADRSQDDGKTWVKDFQRIDARRIGPARTLEALTNPKKSSVTR